MNPSESKENLVFDKTIITLESQQENDIHWDFVEANYQQYERGSVERDFLIKLSSAFSVMQARS